MTDKQLQALQERVRKADAAALAAHIARDAAIRGEIQAGRSMRELGDVLGVSAMTVSRIVKAGN